MKQSLFVIVIAAVLLAASISPLTAEVRVGVTTEFYNSLASIAGIDGDWSYSLTGQAGLKFANKGSRAVRGEVSLDFAEVGTYLMPSLRKLYIRPSFGDVSVSVGKTRSTWGAGFAFNAGDVIFGSDSVDFDTRAADPRGETAWLTSVEVPLGDFSFLELITLPGIMDITDIDLTAPEVPKLQDGSAGGRVSLEAGDFNIQAGYLYRGDLIAGLGSTGQRAFISLEGITPIDWHLSTSASTDTGGFSEEAVKESWIITGGASYDHLLGEYQDINLSWRFEFLAKPMAEWEQVKAAETEYGLYLYPSITLMPPGNIAYSLSSIISPIDLSASSTVSISWNIYEELILLGYYSFQAGEAGDVFNINNFGGMSATVGGRYSY